MSKIQRWNVDGQLFNDNGLSNYKPKKVCTSEDVEKLEADLADLKAKLVHKEGSIKMLVLDAKRLEDENELLKKELKEEKEKLFPVEFCPDCGATVDPDMPEKIRETKASLKAKLKAIERIPRHGCPGPFAQLEKYIYWGDIQKILEGKYGDHRLHCE